MLFYFELDHLVAPGQNLFTLTENDLWPLQSLSLSHHLPLQNLFARDARDWTQTNAMFHHDWATVQQISRASKFVDYSWIISPHPPLFLRSHLPIKEFQLINHLGFCQLNLNRFAYICISPKPQPKCFFQADARRGRMYQGTHSSTNESYHSLPEGKDNVFSSTPYGSNTREAKRTVILKHELIWKSERSPIQISSCTPHPIRHLDLHQLHLSIFNANKSNKSMFQRWQTTSSPLHVAYRQTEAITAFWNMLF